MKQVASNLALWMIRWIQVSVRGWARVLGRLLKFLLELLTDIPLLSHLFLVSSIALGVLSGLPWFTYSLDLDGMETYESTTNLWYLFLIPAVSGLLFALLTRPWSFRVQLGADLTLALLFLGGLIFPGLHTDMQAQPAPTSSYYAYPSILLAQMLLSVSLRRPENGILNRMRARWKMNEPV